MPRYDFASGSIPERFFWFNEPKEYSIDTGLTLTTHAKTDFWQRTHYGFRRDNGHCLLTRVEGDFSISTQVEFHPVTQYDQCGLMLRVDQENWIKCSIEYENAEASRLGSVVTHQGFSDWATQDIASTAHPARYRITRVGQDFRIEAALEEGSWQQLRISHLRAVKATMDVGIYACSPIGENFQSRFEYIEIGPGNWQ